MGVYYIQYGIEAG